MHIAAILLIIISASIPVKYFVKIHFLMQFRKKAVCTNAEIMYADKHITYREPDCYRLQIQYKMVDKEIFYMAQTMSAKKYKAGDILPLMYLSDRPEQFKTDFGKRLPWILAFSFLFFSIILWFCFLLLAAV